MGAETRFVKPRDGLIVRDPNTHAQLPPGGLEVPWIGPAGRFFRRRLRQGDIVLVEIDKEEIKEENQPIKEAVKTTRKYKEDKE